MSASRADSSRIGRWWFTIDHALLAAVAVLIVASVVLSLAASPAVAIKKGLPTYFFVKRQLVFAGLGAFVVLAVSMLSPAGVRRLSLGLLLVSFAGLIAVHFAGVEVNGARRWLSLGGHSIQPSEFMKPAFAVVAAWLFAQVSARPDMPALPIAVMLLGAIATLLLLQPDVGQTLLVVAVWGALYVACGLPLAGVAALAAAGAIVLTAAYFTLDYVRLRLDRFLSPVAGDNSQIDRAMQSFAEGGLLGKGPGEGVVKTQLPDAHSDFIFAVVAEEYGILACLALLALFAFIVMRALVRSDREQDDATRLAAIGLAVVFGLQALINMGVNVGLLPAKGMTLPFISSGGSSTLAVSLTLGMLLALTRRRPDPTRLKKPRLVPTIDAIEATGHNAR